MRTTITRTPGFQLGRVAGIEIHADPSWLFALFLVLTSLASGFSRWQTTWGPGTALTVALAGSALFFTSVLLHELAHAVVARALGIPVRGITLFLFGGVSKLEREPDSAGSEFMMAIVGPIASFTLAVLFLLIALAIGGFDQVRSGLTANPGALNPFAAVFLWLAPVNLALGVFNLVPGFPLDGGRVLRAILWRATGNLRRATVIAGAIGQAVGWAFIVVGVAMIFGVRVPWLGRGVFSGLWLAAIGWFLRNAAFGSVRDLDLRTRLAGVAVQQLMRHPPPAVPANATLAMLREHWLYTTGANVFPVSWNERFVGLIDRDAIRSRTGRDQTRTLVSSAMVPVEKIPTVRPGDAVLDVMELFAQTGRPVLPVTREASLIGWLLLEDVLGYAEPEPSDVRARATLWERGFRDESTQT